MIDASRSPELEAAPSTCQAVPGGTKPSSQQEIVRAAQADMIPKSPSPALRSWPTHFLCIPLVTSQSRPRLDSSIAEFKRRLEVAHPRIPAKAVRPVSSIHLTLDVMYLPTPEDAERAMAVLRGLDIGQALRSCSTFGGLPSSLTVDLRSLNAMRNPARTSVLYTTPEDPSGRLESLAQHALDTFTSAGLCHPARPLRLHATVYNTRYITPRQQGRDGRSPQVDARALVKEYKDHVWADEVRLERIAICEMGAEKVRNEAGQVVDEVYREIASVELP